MLESKLKDTLTLWREEGYQKIVDNFEEFNVLLEQAKNCINRGDYLTAAVYGEMAAFYATSEHSGFFVNQELEQILIEISQKTLANQTTPRKKSLGSIYPQRVLHVLTSASAIGGHSRMLFRWIQQDAKRSHSIVLTRQEVSCKVPEFLRNSVQESKGKIYLLNQGIGNLISWSQKLYKIAKLADLVVLHIHNYDVMPIIAFAKKENLPPIIFLDHSDHKFWLGVSSSDIFVNLRESGMRIAQKRRGINIDRNFLLPTIVEPIQRTLSQSQAKLKLNIPDDSIVILSIARSVKYKTVNGITFLDSHISILNEHKKVFLLIVGPGYQDDWKVAIQKAQGRIRVFNETENTELFYQAADIYIDSFPFVSNTSLLEAGSYALPLVSRFPYSNQSEILGADMPGLDGNLIQSQNLEEYKFNISNLIKDENYRKLLGERTREKILETHIGSSWQNFLEKMYSFSFAYNMIEDDKTFIDFDQLCLDEPDIYLPKVHGRQGNTFNHEWLYEINIGYMSFQERWSQWIKTDKSNSYFININYCLPAWTKLFFERSKLGLRKYLESKK